MRKIVPLIAAVLALTLPLWAEAAGGDLDPSFGSGGKVLAPSGLGTANAVAVAPSGKIVADGFSSAGPTLDFALARYNRDGSLDLTFGSGGKVVTDFGADDEALAVAVQPDGKLVAAGLTAESPTAQDFDFALARYNRDGTLDSSFGAGGKVVSDFNSGSFDVALGVALTPADKIVAAGLSVAGANGDFALARYNRDGSPDDSFGSGGKVLTDFGSGSSDGASSVVVKPNGQIVAAGASGANGDTDFALARYNRDGTLAAGFGSGGKVLTDFGGNDSALSLGVRPNRTIVAAGVTDFGGSVDFALAAYNRRGSLDPSFGPGGEVVTDFGGEDFGNGLAIAPNGDVVVAGTTQVAGDADFAVARYDRDGILDPSFGLGGKVVTDFGTFGDTAAAVALTPNSKIVVAGGSAGSFALARYLER